MFTVEIHHHDKDWVRGDLEDKFELIDKRLFKTRTSAKQYIEQHLQDRGTTRTEWHKGDEPSYAYYWTGVTWQHENSGEEMEEYYEWILKKTKVY